MIETLDLDCWQSFCFLYLHNFNKKIWLKSTSLHSSSSTLTFRIRRFFFGGTLGFVVATAFDDDSLSSTSIFL